MEPRPTSVVQYYNYSTVMVLFHYDLCKCSGKQYFLASWIFLVRIWNWEAIWGRHVRKWRWKEFLALSNGLNMNTSVGINAWSIAVAKLPTPSNRVGPHVKGSPRPTAKKTSHSAKSNCQAEASLSDEQRDEVEPSQLRSSSPFANLVQCIWWGFVFDFLRDENRTKV